MQDLGAAGLTSSAVECAARGEAGIEIDVARVPRREPGLTPFEVMLSESQERMLLVVKPDGVDRVREIVQRWSLKAAEIGTVTDTGHVLIRDGAEVVCDVPARYFTDECPTYVRESAEDPAISSARRSGWQDIADLEPGSIGGAVLEFLGTANIGSRRPVYQRYDSTIMTNTVVGPGASDAAVLRIKGQDGGIAISLDCNSRYCYLDPYLGAQLAVAEALRNVSCAGARPLAITNCLNFRNPEKPAGYYQLSRAIAGMADACRALDVVVVSGNVSLYNETADSAIYPTPTIGCVGVLSDVRRHARAIWQAGDCILLLGAGRPTLGGSEYLASMHGRTVGSPPEIDLTAERAVQAVVRAAISAGEVRTAHDISLGGLAIALAEMAIHSGVGAVLNLETPGRLDELWFGERSASILVATDAATTSRVLDRAQAAGVPAAVIGTVEGQQITFGPGFSIELGDARLRYETALLAAAAPGAVHG
jgi:phosphoribosylformylglycinamidine synthase